MKTFQFQGLCQLDIEENTSIYRHDNQIPGSLPPTISKFSFIILGAISKENGCALSGYTKIEGLLLIVRAFSILYTIFRTWCSWVHWLRPSPALVLDPLGQSVRLRDWFHALSCGPTLCEMWSCSGPALVCMDRRTASRRAVLISSYRNSSDLVMVHMISVKYPFNLSLDSARDARARG